MYIQGNREEGKGEKRENTTLKADLKNEEVHCYVDRRLVFPYFSSFPADRWAVSPSSLPLLFVYPCLLFFFVS